MEWETIDNFHLRAKVFNGWLVKAYENIEHANYMEENGYWARTQSQELRMSITFVPDSSHEWKIEENTNNLR